MSDKRVEVSPTLDLQWATVSRGKEFVHIPVAELPRLIDILRQVAQDADMAR